MRSYLMLLGVAIIALGLVGGAMHLSLSYNEYQSRLREMGVAPGASIALYDVVKWQFARLVGGAIIFGSVIFGSLLVGLSWVGRTLEEIRDGMVDEVPGRSPKELTASRTANG
jgi:uncharacterized membrane protein